MGFFDGLRRDKKQAEPVQQEQRVEADAVEDEIAIEHIEVVERAPHETPSVEEEPIEERPVIERFFHPLVSRQSPLQACGWRTKIMAIINQKAASANLPRLSTFLRLWEAWQQVLLVDLDPQGNSSSGLGIEKSQVNNCIYDAAQRRAYRGSHHSRCVRGLDLVPATHQPCWR